MEDESQHSHKSNIHFSNEVIRDVVLHLHGQIDICTLPMYHDGKKLVSQQLLCGEAEASSPHRAAWDGLLVKVATKGTAISPTNPVAKQGQPSKLRRTQHDLIAEANVKISYPLLWKEKTKATKGKRHG